MRRIAFVAVTALPMLTAGLLAAPAPDDTTGDAPAAEAAADRSEALGRVRFELGDLPVQVTAINDDHLAVQFVGRPGSHAEVPLDNVKPEVLYQVAEVRRTPLDREDWLELARLAEKHALHQRRIEALRHAQDLERTDALAARLAEARQACAADRLERARELQALGDVRDARAHLQETLERYPECDAAGKARELLDRWTVSDADEDAQATEATEATESNESNDPLFEEVDALVTEARRELSDGQQASDDYGEAEDHFERALEALRRADEGVTDIHSEHGTGSAGGTTPGDSPAVLPSQAPADEASSELESRHRRWRLRIDDLLVRVHTELGYLALALGADGQAYHHATLAASIDPAAAGVSDLRQAIGAADD